jgi:hypothetical protein
VAKAEVEARLRAGKDVTEEESLQLMRDQMGEQGQAELEAMLAQGVSLKSIMDHFMARPAAGPPDPPPDQDPLSRTDLTAEQKLAALQGSLNAEQQREVAALLAAGLSPEQVVEQLKARAAQARREAIAADPALSTEEKLAMLAGDLAPGGRRALEEMMSQGLSLEEALGKLADREREAEKLQELAGRGELAAGDQAAVEELLRQGVSLEDALREVAGREGREAAGREGREVAGSEGRESTLGRELREAMEGGMAPDQVSAQQRVSAEARSDFDNILS